LRLRVAAAAAASIVLAGLVPDAGSSSNAGFVVGVALPVRVLSS
jgi:hypothetical protein